MTPFEYVSVLLSIVVSLALAHLLIGIAKIIKVGVSRWSIPLLGWIGCMAFLCVDYWISNWHAHAEPLWSLGFVCFLLFSGAVLFVTCWLVMPDIEGTEAIDLAAYHAANRRKYLSTLLIYFCLSVIVNQLLPGFQSPTMLLISGASIALLVSAWIWKSHAVQVGAVVGIYLLMGWYAVMFIPAL